MFVYIQLLWERSSITENHKRNKDSVKLKINASSFSRDFQWYQRCTQLGYDHWKSHIHLKYSNFRNYCISNVFVILIDRILVESASWTGTILRDGQIFAGRYFCHYWSYYVEFRHFIEKAWYDRTIV